MDGLRQPGLHICDNMKLTAEQEIE